MKVFAVHEITRDSIALYVETAAHENGSRDYLCRRDGYEQTYTAAPNCEAPAYCRMPRRLAALAADALRQPLPQWQSVELESLHDLVALVERLGEAQTAEA